MKKCLSLILSVVMVFTALFSIPVVAEADSGYSDAVISSNIKKIKSYIRENGFINGNGNYTVQYYDSSDDLDFYNLMILDSNDNSLTFKVNVEDAETESLFGVVNLEIEEPTVNVIYTESYFWFDSADYSDLGGHAYIDRTYNHNIDYANFYIDYNDTNVSDSEAYNLFNSMLTIGFENWDYMLDCMLDMNMGAVGFHSYCSSHSYKTLTTKATPSANGKVVKACSVCGKIQSTSVINAPKTFTLSATSYNYDGKVKTPAVTVKDSKGKTLVKNTDYTVTYASGRKNVGKYAVKITFKGKYSGSKTLYFTIKPRNTSITSLTAGSKKFTVKLKKYTTQTTGYQIQYSTNSKFSSAKTVTVNNKTTSKTISKLAGKKKYYVRVRTYKTVGSAKYYSSWSTAKAVTTKK